MLVFLTLLTSFYVALPLDEAFAVETDRQQIASVDLTKYPDVAKLRSTANDLLQKKLNLEALDTYKDCICLATLRNMPEDQQRKLAIEIARRLEQSNTASNEFYDRALELTRVKSAADLRELDKFIQKSSLNNSFNLYWPGRLEKEVENLTVDDRLSKLEQIKCLTAFFNLYSEKFIVGTDDKGVELATIALVRDLQPPDPELHAKVLQEIMRKSLMSPNAWTQNTTALMQRVVDDALNMMLKSNRYYVELFSSVIPKLVEHGDLKSLIPVLEKNLKLSASRNAGYPVNYAMEQCILGWAYVSNRNYENAVSMFEQATETTKDKEWHQTEFETAQIGIARCYFLQGKIKQAQIVLQDLLKFLERPNVADLYEYESIIQAMLGECLEQQNNYKQARVRFEKANRLFASSYFSTQQLRNPIPAKDQIPNEETVLEHLISIYDKLHLANEKKTALGELAVVKEKNAQVGKRKDKSRIEWKVTRIMELPAVPAADLVYSDLQFLNEAYDDKNILAQKLFELSSISITRGLVNSTTKVLNTADELRYEDKSGVMARRFRRNRALLALLEGNADKSKKLTQVNLQGESADSVESKVDTSILGRSYLQQGNFQEAFSLCSNAIIGWSPTGDSPKPNGVGAVDQPEANEPEERVQEKKRIYRDQYYRTQYDRALALCGMREFKRLDSELKALLIDKTFQRSYSGGYFHPLILSLMARAEAMIGATEESRLNLRQAFGNQSYQRFGPDKAQVLLNAAEAHKALGETDRARRYFYEALSEYQSIMPAEYPDAVYCKERISELTPTY